jgi:hypothetical protein
VYILIALVQSRLVSMTDGTKAMAPIYFSENIIAITVKFTWMIHTSFAIMRLFFHRVSVIFNTLLPTFSKTLYTTVVKFPILTFEHIMKTVSILCHL